LPPRPQLWPVEGCPSERSLGVTLISLACPTRKGLNQEQGRFVASRDHVKVWRRVVTEVHLDSTTIESPYRRHDSARDALVQYVHYVNQTEWTAAEID
jgi:hypothetical protein